MVKTRSSKHATKQNLGIQTSGALKQPESCLIPTVSLGDTGGIVITRFGSPGSSITECLPVGHEDLPLKIPQNVSQPPISKGLGSIAPHLFNLEPRSRPEKLLSIDLDLYQMENL